MLAANAFLQKKEPELLYFKDDGLIPNSKLPLLLYKNAFTARDEKAASWLEQHFAQNNWSNSWRNGIFDFHHYQSKTNEAMESIRARPLYTWVANREVKLK
jgi:uncharacterized protein YjlB